MSPSRQALHSNPIRTKRRTGERGGGGGGPHSSLHTLVPPCPTFNIMTQPTPVRTGSAGPREGRLSLTLIWYYSIFMKSCPIKSWRCKNFFFPHCFLLSHNNTNNQMIDWSRCSSAFHISLYQIEITFFLLSSRVGALCVCVRLGTVFLSLLPTHIPHWESDTIVPQEWTRQPPVLSFPPKAYESVSVHLQTPPTAYLCNPAHMHTRSHWFCQYICRSHRVCSCSRLSSPHS